ncbi:hypothetical protein RUND412_007120 [Rhizina undulata]
MFSSTVKNSQVNNNNNIVIDSGNTNIENMVLNGIQDRELQSLQQPLLVVENRVREMCEKMEGNERLEILKWLSKVDYKEHHDYISSSRQANTGTWLFRKPDFIQWNNSPSSIFWLHGIDNSTELIRQLSRAFEQTVIIVDALDECDRETSHQLMAALKNLRSSTQRLKIFITSRNDDDIRIQFENESESDNSKDIELFVVTEVGKYLSAKRLLGGEVRPELKQAIIATLTKGADGMFLWVRLQLEHICNEKFDTAIRKALQRLPKDLEATYSVIWNKILADTDDNRLLAQRTLKWIICAKRPLSIPEIIEATSITPMKWTEMPDRSSVTHKTLLDVCQNLVVLDKQLGVLRTAHFSVTEFLLKTISSSEAHTAAAEVYVTLLCYENHLSATRRTEENTLDNFALRDYVMKHWVEHIHLSGDGSNTLTELQKDNAKTDKDETPLHVAASNGRETIVRLFLGMNSAAKTDSDRTEGKSVARACVTPIFRRLLFELNGVHLNAKDKRGQTPLYVAAWNGHEGVVRLLLEQKGVLVNAKITQGPWQGQTPRDIAADKNYVKIVQLLDEAMAAREGNTSGRE